MPSQFGNSPEVDEWETLVTKNETAMHRFTWPMLKDNFTEEQLSVLTDLLAAPSYFS